MKRTLDLLTLNAPHQLQLRFLMLVITGVYLFNFHVNDIWTPNESFYAEAVREMFESGNFLEIFYNYEPRYNKPPLTYWLMAFSARIFGLTAFALRLPIVLMGIGSIYLTYLLGNQLYGKKEGLYAMVMMAFSIQLLAVKQYASPEMPLTFFFTLTMYCFIKAYQEKRKKYFYFAYAALGFAVLTKGFPYIIVAAGIIGLFVLLNGSFTVKRIWTDIKRLQLPSGLIITLLIGLSWIIFMLLKDGQAFWEVYYRETFGRALNKASKGAQPFFYLGVLSWSIFPYTLAFIYALYYWIKNRADAHKILFPACWLIVMLIIFTIAKGKLPTYMIQAHPALFLIIAPLIGPFKPVQSLEKALWYFVFLFPTVAIIVANGLMIQQLNMHLGFYLAPLLSIGLFLFLQFSRVKNKNSSLLVAPFWALTILLICFATILPRLEKFRPYDEIGAVINQELKIDKGVPIHIQGTLIHNIPFYAQRYAQRNASIASINSLNHEALALVRAEDLDKLNDSYSSAWSGLIYDFSSESQFAKFIMACIKAENGNFSKFATYHLVYQRD